jgi:hypothetical protein
MNNGPVVSTSFKPNALFFRENRIGTSRHCWQTDMLIVGWQKQDKGEFWVVQTLSNGIERSPLSYIAVGHFGIDDCCLAPISNLEHITWQAGPYVDRDISSVENEWRTWTSINISMASIVKLEDVFKAKGTTVLSDAVVTVRDKTKKAHSKMAKLRSVTWDAVKKQFTV